MAAFTEECAVTSEKGQRRRNYFQSRLFFGFGGAFIIHTQKCGGVLVNQ